MRERIVRRMRARYGAWDDDELSDHHANFERLVWLLACEIKESDDGLAVMEAN